MQAVTSRHHHHQVIYNVPNTNVGGAGGPDPHSFGVGGRTPHFISTASQKFCLVPLTFHTKFMPLATFVNKYGQITITCDWCYLHIVDHIPICIV